MMRFSKLLVTAILLAASVASAHHSMNAEFDLTRPVTWKGEVLSLSWTIPHVYVNVMVRDNAGNPELWKFQGNPPHMMQASGITRDLIRPGAIITINGFQSKLVGPGFSLLGFAREIELPNGRKVEFGSLTWDVKR